MAEGESDKSSKLTFFLLQLLHRKINLLLNYVTGARVRRSIGRPELRNLDPFLMLDEFAGNANDGAGFPDHPHRGFETVAYLLEGMFLHEVRK